MMTLQGMADHRFTCFETKQNKTVWEFFAVFFFFFFFNNGGIWWPLLLITHYKWLSMVTSYYRCTYFINFSHQAYTVGDYSLLICPHRWRWPFNRIKARLLTFLPSSNHLLFSHLFPEPSRTSPSSFLCRPRVDPFSRHVCVDLKAGAGLDAGGRFLCARSIFRLLVSSFSLNSACRKQIKNKLADGWHDPSTLGTASM